MKRKVLNLILSTVLLTFVFACSEDDFTDIGGSQSSIGEVGNSITWGPIQGVAVQKMTVTKLEAGVSTFSCSATTSNSNYTELLKSIFPAERFPGTVNITGNKFEATVNAKITDEGAQVIFNDGSKLTLVNYNSKVGDKYSANIGGVKLENEVIEKSTEDDFYWEGMNIKVIKVRYKSNFPGVLHVDHIYNHKFGLVGLDVYFEDGTVKYIGCVC